MRLKICLTYNAETFLLRVFILVYNLRSSRNYRTSKIFRENKKLKKILYTFVIIIRLHTNMKEVKWLLKNWFSLLIGVKQYFKTFPSNSCAVNPVIYYICAFSSACYCLRYYYVSGFSCRRSLIRLTFYFFFSRQTTFISKRCRNMYEKTFTIYKDTK